MKEKGRNFMRVFIDLSSSVSRNSKVPSYLSLFHRTESLVTDL